MKSVSSIVVLLVFVPTVLNKALPQSENEIPLETTTIPADSDGGEASSTSPKPLPRRLNTEFPRVVIDDVANDYDMFLDHVNKTAQYKLELFDKTLETELQPGRPLMALVEFALGVFQQLQTSNSRRRWNSNSNKNNNNNNGNRKRSN